MKTDTADAKQTAKRTLLYWNWNTEQKAMDAEFYWTEMNPIPYVSAIIRATIMQSFFFPMPFLM